MTPCCECRQPRHALYAVPLSTGTVFLCAACAQRLGHNLAHLALWTTP